jgi:hypothetical protein
MKKCVICEKELLKRQRSYCSNKCKFSDQSYNSRRVCDTKNDKTKKLISLLDGWETTDILNKSGVITRYLLKKHNKILSGLDDYKKFFIEKQVDIKQQWKCPYCDWQTNDTNNKSGAITVHLRSVHKKSISDLIEEHPADASFSHSKFSNNRLREIFINDSIDNRVECGVCGELLKEITNSHLKKHKMTCEEYKKQHGELLAPVIKEKFTKNLAEIDFDSSSKAEKEIREFLIEHGVPANEMVYNNKKIIAPHELDIFVTSKNIGIEYNGLYFHSEIAGNKHKDYHLSKTQSAEKLQIKLIQIFEDEWKYKRNIVESRLLSSLGMFESKIGARSLTIQEITQKEKSKFLLENHLQGNDKSSKFYGLFKAQELLSVMTFSRPRLALGNKTVEKNVWELVRFCSKNKFLIVGGFSKLLNFFVKSVGPKKIITYADRRYSSMSDNVYVKNGFSVTGATKPNYFYMKKYDVRKHRFGFNKKYLIKKYNIQDTTPTEAEIMRSLRYDRIWDCGHIKFELVLI